MRIELNPHTTLILFGVFIILGGLILYGTHQPYSFPKPVLPRFSESMPSTALIP